MIELYDAEELRRLTGSARATAQAGWLKDHGIPYKIDAKRVIVSRVHVRAWLEGKTIVTSTGPNWGALKRAAAV